MAYQVRTHPLLNSKGKKQNKVCCHCCHAMWTLNLLRTKHLREMLNVTATQNKNIVVYCRPILQLLDFITAKI